MSQLFVADRFGANVTETAHFKKADPPKLGPAYGHWAGRDTTHFTLPGGAVMQFDLSKLTIADFRAMRDHYQINLSLTVLQFMLHQLDWKIECKNAKIRDQIEENMRTIWTRLVRGMSVADWAGFAPCALEYENGLSGYIELTKVKDLLPEESRVHWKKVKGYAPRGHVRPTFFEYDGISQFAGDKAIPPINTLWYSLLMEGGDYYGRKLLRPAFPSWFFSILIHLFANRYYERFGEPLPIGRAPFDDDVPAPGGGTMSGKTAMENILTNLRNRSVVTLPSDRDEDNNYDYDISYLESQMRGGDFERYIDKLDEEMSLSIFTPVLLLRTADVGSYNLGVGHMQMYLWMLNSLAGDMKEYIDRYIVKRLHDVNFGPNAEKAEWVPRQLGKENVETLRAVITGLISSGTVKPDLDELGVAIGLTLEEVEVITEPEPEPELDEDGNPIEPPPDEVGAKRDKRVGRPERSRRTAPRGTGEPRATGRKVTARIGQQAGKAFREGTFGPDWKPKLGFRNAFVQALRVEGVDQDDAAVAADQVYGNVQRWLEDAVETEGMFTNAEAFTTAFQVVLDSEIEARCGA